MALLDTADSTNILNLINDILSDLESQDWGPDESQYNEALARLEAFRRQIVVLSPDEDEDDATSDDSEPTSTA